MKLKNLFIISDLEGIAGVTRFEQSRESGPLNDRAKELFTKEANVVINAINKFDPGIDVHFWDAHGKGSAIKEKLAAVANFIPHGLFGMGRYFAEHRINALMFVGQHAMANIPNGNLSHTISSRTVEYYKLNGNFIGEFGVRAALAGELGVSSIFISGDDKACEEARALVPDIITCDVKKGTGLESAEYPSFEEVYKRIEKAVPQALESWSQIKPYKVRTPVTLEVKYKKRELLIIKIICFVKILQIFRKRNAKEICGESIFFNADSMSELEKTKLF